MVRRQHTDGHYTELLRSGLSSQAFCTNPIITIHLMTADDPTGSSQIGLAKWGRDAATSQPRAPQATILPGGGYLPLYCSLPHRCLPPRATPLSPTPPSNLTHCYHLFCIYIVITHCKCIQFKYNFCMSKSC